MSVHPRLLREPVENAMKAFPVVALLGARQTGKTTLAREIAASKGLTYHNLDDARTRDAALRDPDGFLLSNPSPLVLDEVQRAPDLLRAVKIAVDRDRTPGMYLLTGSANYLLLRNVSESLAGRVALFEIQPLAWPEWRDATGPTLLEKTLEVTSVKSLTAFAPRDSSTDERALRDRILRGGMPVPGAMTSHENRNLWFDGYLHTYLERDIRDLARIQSLPDFDRLLRLVAARTGKILSYSDLARDAALSVSTARSYLNLATIAYFVRLLRPFHSNLGKRLVKAPKAMLLDSGLAAHFLGASVFADLERSNQVGAIVETWVHAQILALLGRRSKSECLYYWRTHAGAEVDFVIEHGERLLPIEVKWSTTVSPSDLRGLTSFLDDHAERAPFGLVLHRAASPMALGPRILSLPLTALFERAARR